MSASSSEALHPIPPCGYALQIRAFVCTAGDKLCSVRKKQRGAAPDSAVRLRSADLNACLHGGGQTLFSPQKAAGRCTRFRCAVTLYRFGRLFARRGQSLFSPRKAACRCTRFRRAVTLYRFGRLFARRGTNFVQSAKSSEALHPIPLCGYALRIWASVCTAGGNLCSVRKKQRGAAPDSALRLYRKFTVRRQHLLKKGVIYA